LRGIIGVVWGLYWIGGDGDFSKKNPHRQIRHRERKTILER
jgi:hypothetical protein